jgi:hypothetical protein
LRRMERIRAQVWNWTVSKDREERKKGAEGTELRRMAQIDRTGLYEWIEKKEGSRSEQNGTE